MALLNYTTSYSPKKKPAADPMDEIIRANPDYDPEVLKEGYADIIEDTQKYGRQRIPATPELLDQLGKARIKDRTKYDIGGGLKAMAKGFGAGLLTTPIQAAQGSSGADVVSPDVLERAASGIDKWGDEGSQDLKDRKFLPGIPAKEAAQAGKSLGYSVATMGASILGGIAGTAAGGGPTPLGVAGGYAGAMAASGTVAYRATSYQLMKQILEYHNEGLIKERGSGLTEEEQVALRDKYDAEAIKSGLYEAIPESLSNIFAMKAFSVPLKAFLAKMIGEKAAGNAAVRIMARMGGALSVETGTETITQMGQNQAAYAAGIPGSEPTDMGKAGDWWKAFKQVAPQTILQTALMGGVMGGGARVLTNRKIGALKKIVEAGEHTVVLDTNDGLVVLRNMRDFAQTMSEERPKDTTLKSHALILTEEIAKRESKIKATPTDPIVETAVKSVETMDDLIDLKNSGAPADDINKAIIEKQAGLLDMQITKPPADDEDELGGAPIVPPEPPPPPPPPAGPEPEPENQPLITESEVIDDGLQGKGEGETEGEIVPRYKAEMEKGAYKSMFDVDPKSPEYDRLAKLRDEIGKDVVGEYKKRMGDSKIIVLSDKPGEKGVIIHPSTKKPGRFQLTRWDKRGFAGDSTFDTLEAAAKEAYQDDTARVPNPELFKRITQSDEFLEGVANTEKVQREFRERRDAADKPAARPEAEGEITGVPTVAVKKAAGTPEDVKNAYIENNIVDNDGSWDRSTIRNYADAFILPIAKRIEKSPWSSYKDLAVQPKSKKEYDASKDLGLMVESGFAQVAWDKKGMPHYAKKSEAVPGWLTQTTTDEARLSLPDKKTADMTKAEQPAAEPTVEKKPDSFSAFIETLQPMQKGKTQKVLSEQVKHNKYGTITKQEEVEKLSTDGFIAVAKEAVDATAVTKAKEERSRIFLSGNQNIQAKRVTELDGIISNPPKKVSYRFVDGSGSIYDINKTQYDYAKYLEAAKTTQPTEAPAAEHIKKTIEKNYDNYEKFVSKNVADGLAGKDEDFKSLWRRVPSKNALLNYAEREHSEGGRGGTAVEMMGELSGMEDEDYLKYDRKEALSTEPAEGSRFTDKDGNLWEVWGQRYGVVTAHPVINDKPDINRVSRQQWAFSDLAKQANPGMRADINLVAADKTSQDEYKIEKYEGTQVGYGKPGRKGSMDRTRKLSGFLVTAPDGNTKFFDTKKEGQEWIDSQKEPAVSVLLPKKRAKAFLPKERKESKVSTLRGRIREMGNLRVVGKELSEFKEMPMYVRVMLNKNGTPLDLAVETLVEEGWLPPGTTVDDFKNGLRWTKHYVRQGKFAGGDSITKREEDKTDAEKRFEKEMNYEPEIDLPPQYGEVDKITGEPAYIQVAAEDLPEGVKLTIHEARSRDGWDTYTVVQEPFSVKLIDGETIELNYGDVVEVRRSDLEKTKSGKEALKDAAQPTQPELIKTVPKIFDEPTVERGKPAKQEKLAAADKVKGQGATEQTSLFEPNQQGLFDRKGNVKETVKSEQKPVIEDFGEKIGGARKDYYSQFADRMKEAKAVDIKTEPFAKSWPEPNYEKMIEEGADPWIVAFVRSARDEVPTKPKGKWGVGSWADKVKLLREFAEKLLTTETSVEALKNKLSQPEYKYLNEHIGGRVDLYLAVGHGMSLKGVTFSKIHWSLYKGQENVDKWMVEKKTKATAFSNMPSLLAIGDTKQEALDAFKDRVATAEPVITTKVSTFDIYSMDGDKKIYIGKKIGHNYVDLESFDTKEEAKAYLKNNRKDLEEKLEKYKYVPNEREETNRERIGTDHRNGKDVTPEMFSGQFGFRGVEFGNWVNPKERQDNLNRAYDALMDLSIILGIPQKAISLNGELALAFGARGTGGIHPAAAHYEPDKVVINLTKKNGPGSLAHEWWHAIDNYFSRSRGQKDAFISELPTKIHQDPTRAEMIAAFGNIVDNIRNTGMAKRAGNLDLRRSKPYWATTRELVARAFESYMVDKLSSFGNVNDYLANIKNAGSYSADMINGLLSGDLTAMDMYPYLLGDEIESVADAFNNLFETMQTKETDKGTVLYSKTKPSVPGVSIKEIAAGFKGRPMGLDKDGNILVKVKDKLITIYQVDQIDDNTLELVFGTRGDRKPGEEIIGAQHRDKIILSKLADRWTVAHESWHLLEKMGIITPEMMGAIEGEIRSSVRKGKFRKVDWSDIDDRLEARAEFGTALQQQRDVQRGTVLGKIQQVLSDFVDAVVNLWKQTAQGVVRGVESGKVFGKEGDTRVAASETDPNIMYQQAADKWFSQMEKFLAEKLPRKSESKSLANTIQTWAKPKGLFKPEELEWSGLIPWLEAQRGTVTKQQVLDFLAANNVRVEEVAGGGELEVYPEGSYMHPDTGDVDTLAGWREVTEDDEEGGPSVDEQLDTLIDVSGEVTTLGRIIGRIKFPDAQFPGGENPREVRLTLAQKMGDLVGFTAWAKKNGFSDEQVELEIRNPSELTTEYEAWRDRKPADFASKTYRSGHFPEPNIVVHVLFNERTIPGVGRGYMIGELQSDWHQEGRKKGYKNSKGVAAILNKYGINENTQGWEYDLGKVSTEEEARIVRDDQFAVPDAPFKKTWPLLAIKRMIRFAAENGMDFIAFPKGEFLFDRYGSEEIAWEKQGEAWRVHISEQVGGRYAGIDIENEARIRGLVNETRMRVNNKQQFSDLVREILLLNRTDAELNKIIDRAWDRMQTEDIGTSLPRKEGFEGFYDKILPAEINQFFNKKEWGNAKVGETKIESEDKFNATSSDGTLSAVFETEKAAIVWLNMKEKRIAEREGREIGTGTITKVPGGGTVHSLTITPEMRQKALHEGMPLFQTAHHGTPHVEKLDAIREAESGGKELIWKKSHFGYVASDGKNILSIKKYRKADGGHAWIPRLNTSSPVSPAKAFDSLSQAKDYITAHYKQVLDRPDGKGDRPQYTDKPSFSRKQPLGSEPMGVEDHIGALDRLNEDYTESTVSFIDKIGTLLDPRKVKMTTTEKPDLSYTKDMLLSVPQYFSSKIPAVKKMWDAVIRKPDHYAELLFGLENHDGANVVSVLEGLDKTSPTEFARLNRHLLKADEYGLGFKVVPSEKEFEVHNFKDEKQGVFKTEAEALEKQIELEILGYEGSDKEKEALTHYRLAMNRGFDVYIQHVKDMIAANEKKNAKLKEKGKPPVAIPKVVTYDEAGKKVMISLEAAMAKMGELRGSYFPRIRQKGNYILTAKKEGVYSFIHTFNFENAMKSKANEYESRGYTVSMRKNDQLTEDVFELSGSLIKTQQILNSALEKMDKVTDEEFEAVSRNLEISIAESLAESVSNILKGRGGRVHMIKRSNTYYKGFEENMLRSTAQYLKGIAAMEAKRTMMTDMTKAFTGMDVTWDEYQEANEDAEYDDWLEVVKENMIEAGKQPNAFKWGKTYIQEMGRNKEFADRVIDTVKGIAVAKFLAFRMFAAPAINLTALATSVPATMHGAGVALHKAPKLLASAIWSYGKYRRGQQISSEDKFALEHIQRNGWDNPQYSPAAHLALQSKFGRAYDKVIRWAMITFSESERLNRGATILATYNGLKTGEESQEGKLALLDRAKQVSDDAHGTYNRGNMPFLGMGANPAAQAVKSFYVFQTFSHNYMLNMLKLGVDKKDLKAVAYMLASPAVIAGMGASVLTPIVATLLKALGMDDPEEDLYEKIGEVFSPGTETVARFGLAGALGASLKGSLSINATSVPTTLPEILGAPYGVLQDFGYGIRDIVKGNVMKGTESILPTGVGNLLKAYRESTEGLTTRNNAPLFYGDEPVKLTPVETFYKGLSFNPVRIAQIREKQWNEKQTEAEYTGTRTGLYSKLRKYWLDGGRDASEYAGILGEIESYNEAAERRNLPLITQRSIRRNLKRASRPSRRERERFNN